ncbi:hypothetical protein ACIG5E_36715 [Kitasatospora sp. NPDC053057]
MSAAAVAASGRLVVDRVLDRRNLRAWEGEWRSVEPHWSQREL